MVLLPKNSLTLLEEPDGKEPGFIPYHPWNHKGPEKVHTMYSFFNMVHCFISLIFLFNLKHMWKPGNRNGLLGMNALRKRE